jgi:hypothetical protein
MEEKVPKYVLNCMRLWGSKVQRIRSYHGCASTFQFSFFHSDKVHLCMCLVFSVFLVFGRLKCYQFESGWNARKSLYVEQSLLRWATQREASHIIKFTSNLDPVLSSKSTLPPSSKIWLPHLRRNTFLYCPVDVNRYCIRFLRNEQLQQEEK